MLLGWCGAQVFLNAMYAAVMAAIPDQVPVERRGLIGGLVAIAQTLGIVGGVAIASLTGSIAAGYLATLRRPAAADAPLRPRLPRPGAAAGAPAAAVRARPVPPRRSGSRRASTPTSPGRGSPGSWSTSATTSATLYLLFYVIDGLGVSEDEADDRVLVLTALYAVTTVATTAVFGHWSDRIGRRKVFVIWSGIVSGVASLVLGDPADLAGRGRGGGRAGLRVRHLHRGRLRADHPGAARRGRARQGPRRHQHRQRAPPGAGPGRAPASSSSLVALAAAAPSTTDGEGWSVGYGAVYGFSFAVSLLGSVLVTRIRSVP